MYDSECMVLTKPSHHMLLFKCVLFMFLLLFTYLSACVLVGAFIHSLNLGNGVLLQGIFIGCFVLVNPYFCNISENRNEFMYH